MNGSFTTLIGEHLSRRPAMELRDIYKLLYQGVRGPEHILSSTEAFSLRLAAEWQSLEMTQDEPLYETIRPDGELLRVNLRPYKASRSLFEDLVAACLEAGSRTWGTQTDLEQTWEEFLTVCRTGHWCSPALQEYERFTSWLQENNFPAVHHSEPYRRLYRPAYRLVFRAFTPCA